ncbi:uncharacterized protein LOC143469566 [Clavelina lepadiformis]|uniref:uncharacterized protein LOC143469566 n=1 Tax=Clavelina lepadiformis TaxID=159417 RepID=UPI0040422353
MPYSHSRQLPLSYTHTARRSENLSLNSTIDAPATQQLRGQPNDGSTSLHYRPWPNSFKSASPKTHPRMIGYNSDSFGLCHLGLPPNSSSVSVKFRHAASKPRTLSRPRSSNGSKFIQKFMPEAQSCPHVDKFEKTTSIGHDSELVVKPVGSRNGNIISSPKDIGHTGVRHVATQFAVNNRTSNEDISNETPKIIDKARSNAVNVVIPTYSTRNNASLPNGFSKFNVDTLVTPADNSVTLGSSQNKVTFKPIHRTLSAQHLKSRRDIVLNPSASTQLTLPNEGIISYLKTSTKSPCLVGEKRNMTKHFQHNAVPPESKIGYSRQKLSASSRSPRQSYSLERAQDFRRKIHSGLLSPKSKRSYGDGATSPTHDYEVESALNKKNAYPKWELDRAPGDGEECLHQSVSPDAQSLLQSELSSLDVNNEDEEEEHYNDEDDKADQPTEETDFSNPDIDDVGCLSNDEITFLEDDMVDELPDEEEPDLLSRNTSALSRMSTEIERSSQLTDMVCRPAVIKSIFSNCPPVINFATKANKIEPLPPNIRKLLKWKMSSITPVVVRNTVMRSGFKPSKKGQEWIGYFGKHMKSSGFRSIKEFQKINHFPGSFQLGRKDRLWRNISRMQARFGKKEFGFVPQSYLLPWDKKLLKNAWEEGSTKQRYILKPPASARGIGIRVIHKWSQIPTKKPILVQKYLGRPYLINGNKFDLRLYVHVTSFDPLRIYLFGDGLVRFATCKYSSSVKHIGNRYMHLTNYSINKKSGEFQQNDDASICQGHKWSLTALWGFLQQQGINTDKIWERMKDIIIKTIISVEQITNSLIKSNCRRPYCCHELFGFDIMLDDHLRPWLLEVNISPSLHSNSPLDVEIKGPMVKDMLNLCGLLLPDKKVIVGNSSSNSKSGSSMGSYSLQKRKQCQEVSADSKAKHSYFMHHFKSFSEKEIISFMLDILTVNDIQVLVETEEELARCGEFQRIFPTTNKKYLQIFEQPRYLNVFLYAWEVKYKHQKSRGHALLESYCRKGLHLPQNISDPANVPAEHVWNISMLSQYKITPSPRTDGMLQQSTKLDLHSHSSMEVTSESYRCRTVSRKSPKV